MNFLFVIFVAFVVIFLEEKLMKTYDQNASAARFLLRGWLGRLSSKRNAGW